VVEILSATIALEKGSKREKRPESLFFLDFRLSSPTALAEARRRPTRAEIARKITLGLRFGGSTALLCSNVPPTGSPQAR
jgi:hypothetical protein